MNQGIGFLLMISGWVISLAAVALLSPGPAQIAFLITAIAIQILGFIFIARSYLPRRSNLR